MKIIEFAMITALSLAGVEAACAQAKAPCQPVQTAGPNAPDQKPAFPGQTRACAEKTAAAFDVTVIAKGLERPWAVEPLPDGSFLVTERPGRLRIISAKGEVGEPIAGISANGQQDAAAAKASPDLPRIAVGGQGGLLDVALSPDFQKDNTIYWSFSEQREGGSGTSVARGVL